MKWTIWITVFLFAICGCQADVTMTPSGSWEISGTCLSHGASYFHSTLSLGMDISFTDNITAHISTLSRLGNEYSLLEFRESYIQLGTTKKQSISVSTNRDTFVNDWEADRLIGQQYSFIIDTPPSKSILTPDTIAIPDSYVTELVFSEFNLIPPARYCHYNNA